MSPELVKLLAAIARNPQEPAVQLPCVHVNGTGAQTLAQGWGAAYRAVIDALRALEAIEFNGRDYYPLGDEAWQRARDEMALRAVLLTIVKRELEVICDHVQMEVDNRQKR